MKEYSFTKNKSKANRAERRVLGTKRCFFTDKTKSVIERL